MTHAAWKNDLMDNKSRENNNSCFCWIATPPLKSVSAQHGRPPRIWSYEPQNFAYAFSVIGTHHSFVCEQSARPPFIGRRASTTTSDHSPSLKNWKSCLSHKCSDRRVLTLKRNTPAFLAFWEQLKCFWTTLSIVCSLAFWWSSPVIRDPRAEEKFYEDRRWLRIRRSLPGTLASDDKAERNQQSPNLLPWWMSLASRPSVNEQSELRRQTWPSAFSLEKISNSSSWNKCS